VPINVYSIPDYKETTWVFRGSRRQCVVRQEAIRAALPTAIQSLQRGAQHSKKHAYILNRYISFYQRLIQHGSVLLVMFSFMLPTIASEGCREQLRAFHQLLAGSCTSNTLKTS